MQQFSQRISLSLVSTGKEKSCVTSRGKVKRSTEHLGKENNDQTDIVISTSISRKHVYDVHSYKVIILGEVLVPDLDVEGRAIVVHPQVKTLHPLWVQGLGLRLTLVLLRAKFELAVRIAQTYTGKSCLFTD